MNESQRAPRDDERPLYALPGGITEYSVAVQVTGEGGHIETISARFGEFEMLTLHKTGVRWSNSGPYAADLRLEDTASYVLRRVLLERLPSAASELETRVSVDRLVEEAGRLGERIWKADTWQRRVVTVDGSSYALFHLGIETTTVGIVDVGPLRIATIGPTLDTIVNIDLVRSDRLRRPNEIE